MIFCRKFGLPLHLKDKKTSAIKKRASIKVNIGIVAVNAVFRLSSLNPTLFRFILLIEKSK
jgi:hypothetical protein